MAWKVSRKHSSSVSFGGGKKRLDAGARTGDGVPAEVELEVYCQIVLYPMACESIIDTCAILQFAITEIMLQ